VALALVSNPQILFLDVPTSGLDLQARCNIWDIVESGRQKGKTVFIVAHCMEEAECLCDRVAIIDHGEILLPLTDQTNSLINTFTTKA